MNLGTQSAQWGSPLAPLIRKLTVDVIADPVTIGFRTSGSLLVMHATPCMCELRQYGNGGKLIVLGSYSGGRQVACEEVEGRLVFYIDDDCIFSAPAGKSEWTLYRA